MVVGTVVALIVAASLIPAGPSTPLPRPQCERGGGVVAPGPSMTGLVCYGGIHNFAPAEFWF
ncbi:MULTISPECIES: hypothetical protein [Actinomadura]|uniref:Uncharacterized protein n=1 Tax=Actinomadura litoris TaxID=2678616 RepID=A0A7K1KUH9_9ACTN|nr:MULTISPECIES: hypothetical protein [Actinomadura]MBT2207347.1 hypothetical protein [Actinomadura sp. NEAU-AAG7]MUN35844.1 hypothetical protein [Actinomadura litoris]